MQDLIRGLKDKKFNMFLPSNLWATFDRSVLNIIQESEWHTFKYFKNVNVVSDEINKVSNSSGGIYIFYVSPEIIPERHRTLMYIGRCHNSGNQNLRKRLREYLGYLPPNYDRPKIAIMMSEWQEDLFCSYIELKQLSDDEIDEIEKELINKLLPPFNEQIPDIKISGAKKAAGL
jgi:hypothetical protein